MPPRPTNTLWSIIASALLLLAGGVAAGFAGREGAHFMFDLDQTSPALARVQPLIATPPAAKQTDRVVLVIIDGLRLDTSLTMPFLNELRGRGLALVARSQYPTYSRPNYVNILTGVPPAASGVRTNRYPGTVTLDSLMDRVRAEGLHAGFASDNDPMPGLFLRPRHPDRPMDEVALEDMQRLHEEDHDETALEIAERGLMANLRGDFDDARYAPWPGGFRDASEELLRSDDALVVMHIAVVDVAGHARGGDSEAYREAATFADVTLDILLGDLDLSRTTLIVTADHGHTNAGGHGGLEPVVVQVPLILVGAGIDRAASVEEADLQDVAPTAARLLGIAAPGHALGRSLVEAIGLDDDARDRIAAQDAIRTARNTAIVAAGVYEARKSRLGKRARRIAVVILGGISLIGAAWWLWQSGGLRMSRRSLLLGVPGFFFVYYLLIATLGQRFSPSALPARGHIASELIKYGVVGAVAQISLSWLALRHRLSLPERLAEANGIAVVGLTVAMMPVALLWAVFPAPYVEVPGPRLMVLIPAVEVSVACYAIGVAVTLLVEVLVFFSRAVDPRVRMMRLERALSRAKELAEMAERGELPRKPARTRRPRP